MTARMYVGWQCPHCPTRITGYRWALWNHLHTHNPDGHPFTVPEYPDPCTRCGARMRSARAPEKEGLVRVGCHGLCYRCYRSEQKSKDKLDTPQREKYTRDVLLEELERLTEDGVWDRREQAARLGMRPSSLKRAVLRIKNDFRVSGEEMPALLRYG